MPATSNAVHDVPASDPVEEAAAELTRLLLDDLGPVVQRYRSEVGRRLGLSPRELACLDLLRSSPRSAAALGERVGLGRSAAAELVARLERRGHVERGPRPGHEQELEVALRPHAERDALLDRLREHVHRAMREAVVTFGVHRSSRLATLVGVLIHATACLHEQAVGFAETAARERQRVRRHRQRFAAPASWI